LLGDEDALASDGTGPEAPPPQAALATAPNPIATASRMAPSDDASFVPIGR